MKLKAVFLFLFLNLSFLQTSYAQKYNEVDKIVLKYPKHFSSIEDVAEKINKDFTSERDKARAIFSWMAFNIDYDLETYLNPPAPTSIRYRNEAEKQKKIQLLNEQTYERTFNSKKAVCEGFSLLYSHLASLVGLRSQVIKGDSKTLLSDIGRKNTISNHAWNTVQVDGKWILVDVTWGQGSLDGNRGALVKEFKPIYFDMEPKFFFTKHYPDSGIFEDHKMNKIDFLNGPLLYNETFEEDYEIIAPSSGIIKANDGDKLIFKIKNIAKFEDVYYLDKKNKPIKARNIKVTNKVLEFEITYNKNIGRFITFFIYGKSIASFKVIPK